MSAPFGQLSGIGQSSVYTVHHRTGNFSSLKFPESKSILGVTTSLPPTVVFFCSPAEVAAENGQPSLHPATGVSPKYVLHVWKFLSPRVAGFMLDPAGSIENGPTWR